jgi:cytochrome P450
MISQSPALSAVPPGPGDQFEIGDTDDSLERMARYYAEYGDFYRVHAPRRGTDTYVISDPEAIKRVLVTNHRNYTKGVGINRVKVLLGNGIMVSEGELWHRQRRMMQPSFHRRHMVNFFANIENCNRALLAEWQARAARGETVNLTEDVSRMTLDIVLRALFSDDLEVLANRVGGNPFTVLADESARDLRFAARFRALAHPIGELIKQRRERAPLRRDLLAMLMQARDKNSGLPMPDKSLIDEVMTLIVAGHETTASGLNWLWYLLSGHPEVTRRLHAELDALEGEPTPQQILELPYLGQVIDEALRLYPPGWLITRRAIADDELGGYPVPAGTDVFISPYLVHRNPRCWERPEQFDPDRFRDAAVKERNRFAYLPFVAGPRHCIGEAFALTEMRIHVARAALRFDLQLAGDQAIEMEARVNLRTRQPLIMRPLPR